MVHDGSLSRGLKQFNLQQQIPFTLFPIGKHSTIFFPPYFATAERPHAISAQY